MNVKRTEYNNSDKQYSEIMNFLSEVEKTDSELFWDTGRMIFWRHAIHGKKNEGDVFFAENVKLWVENGRVIGLCISEYGRDDMFVIVLPSHTEIYDDMFDWIESTWGKDKECIEMDVSENDADKIKLLEKHGYQLKMHYENLRTYDMKTIDLSYKLEDGFTIQAFYENMNFESRVEVVKSAFENNQYSKENLLGLHSSEDYVKDLDLCVVSPKGQIAAYCIGWKDKNSEHSGYIEPVGTHKDFRKRGFASAIIKECFARMKAMGMDTVVVASRAEPNISNFLYDSLKPIAIKRILKYTKAK